MSRDAAPPDVTVDATGLRCPLPVIRLARAARDAAAGTVVELLSTDPAAGPDVVAWCRMRRQELLGQRQDGEVLHSTVRVTPGGLRSSGAPAEPAPPAPPPAGAGTPPG